MKIKRLPAVLFASLLLSTAWPLLNAGEKTGNGPVDAAFLPPAELEQRMGIAIASGGSLQVQAVDPGCQHGANCYESINGEHIHQLVEGLTDFAEQSRDNGDILWGRVMGSTYEASSAKWVREQLSAYGVQSLELEQVALAPQWRPTAVELTLLGGSSAGSPEKDYVFASAMSGFGSVSTPEEGLEAPLVYVGLGTRADLIGRDLDGKIALVHGRVWADGVTDSSGAAVERLALEHGALGVIVMLDRPGNGKMLARGGQHIPHINLGFVDGTYLRKVIEHSTAGQPPMVRMTIQSEMVPGLSTSVVSGVIPGTTAENIILQAHLDGYWSAINDNGNGVAAVMSLAKYYAALPQEQRRRNLVILIAGGHEDGSVGTAHFARNNTELLNDTIFTLELEHVATTAINETISYSWELTSSEAPVGIFVVDQSPVILQAFRRAAKDFGIVVNQTHLPFYWGDIIGLMPSGVNVGGWVGGSFFYHNSLDSLEAVTPAALRRITAASAQVIDTINQHSRSELEAGNVPFELPEEYQGTGEHYIPGPLGKILGLSRSIW